MNKILSALPLLCVVVSSIKADSSPTTQVNSDIPQTSYVPSATTFQNSDISVCARTHFHLLEDDFKISFTDFEQPSL